MQEAADHTSGTGYDIKNMAADGANTFDANLCLTALNAPCPTVPTEPPSALERDLRASVCAGSPPALSCRAPVAMWNDGLAATIGPDVRPLVVVDGSRWMTVQEYLAARAAAGVDSPRENRK